MSKRPRRTRSQGQRPAPAPRPTQTPEAASPAAEAATAGGSRSTRPVRSATRPRRTDRPTRRTARERSFFDRYRSLLLGGFALLGVGLIGFVFINSANAQPYSCGTLLSPAPSDPIPTEVPTFRPTPTATVDPSGSPDGSPSASPDGSPSPSPDGSPSPSPSASTSPTASASASPGPSGSASPDPSASASTDPSASPSPSPSPSPVPQPTQRAGQVVPDMGQNHVPVNSSIEYAFCPPASGPHYGVGARSPLPHGFYEAGSGVSPGNWVHNLEHGYVVIAYQARDRQPVPSTDEMGQLRAFFESAPASTHSPTCQSVPNKVIVVPFEQMTTRFALIAWNRELLVDTWDADEALRFYTQWADSPQAPERGAC